MWSTHKGASEHGGCVVRTEGLGGALPSGGGIWMARGARAITGSSPGTDPEAGTLAHSLPV